MRAFLFGNGASIPYGSPPGSQILARAFELLYDSRRHTHELGFHVLRNTVTSLVSLIDELYRKLAWGSPDSLHAGVLRTELEAVLCPDTPPEERMARYSGLSEDLSRRDLWEAFQRILECNNDSEVYGYGTLERKRLCLREGLDNEFDRLAELSFKTIYLALKHSGLRPSYYCAFAEALSDSLDDSLIVNLNYDCLLERALQRGFDGPVLHRLGNQARSFPLQEGAVGHPRVFLFKPHGSFDYLHCPKCDSMSVRIGVPVDAFQDATGRRTCLNPNCKKPNIHSFFIPYTDITKPIKFRAQLGSILTELKQALAEVDQITTVGYSFQFYKDKPIDQHLGFIFEGRQVDIVSSCEEESCQICERMKTQGIQARPTSFAGFANFVRHMDISMFR